MILRRLLDPQNQHIARWLWLTAIICCFSATVLFMLSRAKFQIDDEIIIKIIYAGPIPTLTIIWAYGLLRYRTPNAKPLFFIPI